MPFRQAKWTSRGRPFQKAELGHRSVVDASRGFHMSTADRSAFVLPDFIMAAFTTTSFSAPPRFSVSSTIREKEAPS